MLGLGFEIVVVLGSAYVISAAARLIQKRAKVAIRPERPDARRETGAKRAAKNAKTVVASAIK